MIGQQDGQDGRFVVTRKMVGNVVGKKQKYPLNVGDIIDEHVDPITGRTTFVVGCEKVFRIVIPDSTAGKLAPYVPVDKRQR